MKKLIVIAIALLSLCSCSRSYPKMYSTWDNATNTPGTLYTSEDLRIGGDTVIDGHQITIIHVN